MKIKAVILAVLFAVSCCASDEGDSLNIDYNSLINKSFLIGVAESYCLANAMRQIKKELSARDKEFEDENAYFNIAQIVCDSYLPANIQITSGKEDWVDEEDFKFGIKYGQLFSNVKNMNK